MKRILTISTLLLFLAISFSSCEKFPEDTPRAIKKIIKNIDTHYAITDATVYIIECKYNEDMVYCFSYEPEVSETHDICDKNGNWVCPKQWRYCTAIRIIWSGQVNKTK